MTTPTRQAPRRDPAADPELERVRALARLLDTAVRVPGTNFRFGLDAIVGLVPGLGDIAGGLMSGYLVVAAARMGAPPTVVARMLLNLGVDTVVGAVPVLGDLFDATFRANARNAALLERHVAAPTAARRGSALVVAGAVLGALALVVLAVYAAILLAGALRGWFIER